MSQYLVVYRLGPSVHAYETVYGAEQQQAALRRCKTRYPTSTPYVLPGSTPFNRFTTNPHAR